MSRRVIHHTMASKQEAIARVQAGETDFVIAAKFGVTLSTLQGWMRGHSMSGKRGHFDRDALLEDYRRGDLTLQQIGERHGVSRERVRQIAQEAGVFFDRRALNRSYLEHAADDIITAYLAGARVQDISAALGIPAKNLHNLFKERGIKRRSFDYAAMLEAAKSSLSEPALAAMFNTSQSNIGSVIKRHAPDLRDARKKARRLAIDPRFRIDHDVRGNFKVDRDKVIAHVRANPRRTYTSLAREIGMTTANLTRIIHQFAPDLKRRRGSGIPRDAGRDERIALAYTGGQTLHQLAAEFEVDVPAIRRAIRRADPHLLDENKARENRNAEIARRRAAGESLRTLSEEFGVLPKSIGRIVRQHNS